MNKSATIILICIAALLLICAIPYADIVYLKQFLFNGKDDLRRWNEVVLDGKVNYFIDINDGNGFIHADSKKACSAIFYKIQFKPKEYPILKWKWCVLKFPKKQDLKEGPSMDDYAIRVYVVFPGLFFASFKFIEYIWAEHLPKDHIQQSPTAKNIMQIVVRGGSKDIGRWVQEERNVYEDYERVFGTKTSKSAGAVAIMCNSNLTGSEAEALVDNIIIGTESEIKLEVRKNEK